MVDASDEGKPRKAEDMSRFCKHHLGAYADGHRAKRADITPPNGFTQYRKLALFLNVGETKLVTYGPHTLIPFIITKGSEHARQLQ